LNFLRRNFAFDWRLFIILAIILWLLNIGIGLWLLWSGPNIV
jgi:hypothetical protein